MSLYILQSQVSRFHRTEQVESTELHTNFDTVSYLSKRFVLILLFMLKECVQTVFLHNDLGLIWEEDGVAIERHPQLSAAQIRLCLWHKHGGCSDSWGWSKGDCMNHNVACTTKRFLCARLAYACDTAAGAVVQVMPPLCVAAVAQSVTQLSVVWISAAFKRVLEQDTQTLIVHCLNIIICQTTKCKCNLCRCKLIIRNRNQPNSSQNLNIFIYLFIIITCSPPQSEVFIFYLMYVPSDIIWVFIPHMFSVYLDNSSVLLHSVGLRFF